MKTGIYETEYGNAAIVSEDISKEFAYDLDSAEIIPLQMITSRWLRPADEEELEDFIYNIERGL